MEFDPEQFRVRPGEAVNVAELPARTQPLYESKGDYKAQLKQRVKRLRELQEKLFVENHWSLLIVLQGMDSAGKDGIIRHVLSGINPQGLSIASFVKPERQELEHDFLWRTTLRLPERGHIGLFNRSYYEEVLVVRVHPEILQGQNLPDVFREDESIWQKRYESIGDYERHLHRSGTKVVKFFLNISKDEQKKRLLARVEDPTKYWKAKLGDLNERELWPMYMQAYTDALNATSTEESPWYALPADDKKNTRLLAADIVLRTLEGLDVDYPELTPERKNEIDEIRERLSS